MPVFWLGLGPLAAAAWTDWHTRRIPDACVFLLASCGVLHVAVNGFPPGKALAGLLLLGGIFLLCGILAPASVGGGDIKLCAALGLLLGPLTGSVTLVITLLLGVIYGAVRGEKAVPLAVCILPAYLLILIGS